jgi:hypothetical protein
MFGRSYEGIWNCHNEHWILDYIRGLSIWSYKIWQKKGESLITMCGGHDNYKTLKTYVRECDARIPMCKAHARPTTTWHCINGDQTWGTYPYAWGAQATWI